MPPPGLTISFVEFVALVAALMALTALSIDIMLPALPAIGTALGVASENDRQLVVILYMAGFAAGQLIYGPLSDRFGRRPILLSGLAIFLAGTLGAVMSGSFDGLLIARLIQGLGAASPRIVAVAVVRDLYSGRQMARVMSFAMMVFIIIPVLAPSAGQALLHVGDWRWTFYALLILGVAISIWAGMRLPETSRVLHDGAQRLALSQSFKQAVFEPQTFAYGAAGGFMFGCLLAYVASAQQIFVDIFDLGQAFPIVFGAVASVMAVASFMNARLVGRLGMRRVSHTALAGFLVVSLLLAATEVLGVANLGEVAGLVAFVGLVAILFFLFGFIAPNFNALAMEPQGQNAGMASSVIGSLSTAIGALTGGLIGRSFDGTALPLALGFAGCSLITVAIVLWVDGRSEFARLGRRAAGNSL
ncbi:MAG: multidrug effflux MFS transporter [Hyphomicrobium sp.]|nr:multidrug effflux MFS transporter [Hyphomicrobium sp.]